MKRRGNSAAEAQEASFLHRRTEQPVERSSGSPTGTSMARAASARGPTAAPPTPRRTRPPVRNSWVRQSRLSRDWWSTAGTTINRRACPRHPVASQRRKARWPSPARLESRPQIRVRSVQRVRRKLSDSGVPACGLSPASELSVRNAAAALSLSPAEIVPHHLRTASRQLIWPDVCAFTSGDSPEKKWRALFRHRAR